MNHIYGSTFAWAQPTGSAAPSPTGAAPVEGVATQGAPGGGATSPPGPCGSQSPMQSVFLMLAMFAVFYFLLIRPQQKKAKEHQGMLTALQKGEEVVTTGGLIGRITGVADDAVTMEVSEKVRVRVVKSQIAGRYNKAASTNKAEKK